MKTFAGLIWIFCYLFVFSVPAAPLSLAEAKTHWAFQAPAEPPLPAVSNPAWVRNPIDAFVLARLEGENIRPSAEADRRTLIRRLSLDLVGLLPSPAEVQAFVDDDSPGAYERLVDRLLASPHFGERWGRHWLDLARYADSDGYEKDQPRPYAYLYRDWVIDAFNADMPFDEFTIEQLAGDLLESATLEQNIATGFHRQTLINREGGVDQEEFRCKATVDRTSTTGTVWLGLTVGCAECHSHKYDPISQKEFYQLYAFFNDASDKEVPAPRSEELARYQEAETKWKVRRAALEEQLRAASNDEISGSEGREAGEDGRLEDLKKQLKDLDEHEPKFPATKAAVLENEQPRQTHIHIRGDFLRPGDGVEPATLAVLHPFHPRGSHADRLDLARWLMDPANPLTSRVTVNRIWGHLFGRALVATVGDFGSRGQPPTHPQLLDWLATEFPRRGWSRKAIIRLIVTSATYRQSSHYRAELRERDPENLLLARQNRFRLAAENIRDIFLCASGLLNPAIGGPSIRPSLPADIAALGYANSMRWRESKGGEQFRRGLYIFFQRTVPYPMLTTFDAPDSNVTCPRRERSNTPLQALTLLNDPVFFECAQGLGQRLMQAGEDDPEARIGRAFQICLARQPTAEEAARVRRLYDEEKKLFRAAPEKAAEVAGTIAGEPAEILERATLVAVGRALMNLDEFMTRE